MNLLTLDHMGLGFTSLMVPCHTRGHTIFHFDLAKQAQAASEAVEGSRQHARPSASNLRVDSVDRGGERADPL